MQDDLSSIGVMNEEVYITGQKRARHTESVTKPPITNREHYVGLKCIPSQAYVKFNIPTDGLQT